MTSEWIKRKNLRSKLDSVDQKDWIKLTERLNLTCEGGKGSCIASHQLQNFPTLKIFPYLKA
ncbi:MAG: hypothetical protein WCO09_02970 [bacterium]